MLPYSSANETEHAGKADLDLALRGISEGSTEALETLYRCTAASVYGFAHSILRDHHDAQDVLHDCYVAVWNSAAGYRSQGKPLAWLLTIARNLCLQKLRERKKAVAYDPEFPGIEGAAVSRWRTGTPCQPVWNSCRTRSDRSSRSTRYPASGTGRSRSCWSCRCRRSCPNTAGPYGNSNSICNKGEPL